MTSNQRAELLKLQAALREDATDVRSRLRLADLLVRIGRVDDGIAEYSRAAADYAGTGFYLKASAVYRQILDARPDHAPSYRLLSEIYATLGLANDAVAILHTYLGLIVLPLVRGGQSGEALDKLRALGDLGRCSHDAQSIVLALMADLAPDDPEVLRPFAAVLLAAGRAREATVAAERGLRANPDDLELLETLASAFLRLGDHARGRAAVEHLIATCERSGNHTRLADARKLREQIRSS